MNLLLNDFRLQIDMLKKNLAAFEKRFPVLGEKLRIQAAPFIDESRICKIRDEHTQTNTINTSAFFLTEDTYIFEAKNGEITASYKNMLLHSSYNPSSEAEKTISADFIQKAESIVFFGTGLGYTPAAAAHKFPLKNLIIIEPDPLRLLQAFCLFDWENILKISSCVFLLQADLQTVVTVLEHYGLRSAAHIAPKSLGAHAEDYFSALKTLIARNKDKQDINERTLEKFGTLWLSNMCKNLVQSAQLCGINRYKDGAANLPFCILAAGPSLDDTLPFLENIKKRAVLVCTDTALRFCLRAGIEPHFIFVTDPQYWNARHISDLSSPHSILITESAAYPSVFRFKCREIILCASLFPLGRYMEQFTGKKEALAAGGSVASSAWDFARFCGAKVIYTAGLDLSFPANKTHAKGSTFEENAHNSSTRLKNTETGNSASIYTNPAYSAGKNTYNYKGEPVLTDERMRLYAWWFESKCAAFPDVKTYALSSKSLRIPGIELAKMDEVLALPVRETRIKTFCFETGNTKSPNAAPNENAVRLHNAIDVLNKDLSELADLTAQALALCRNTCRSENDYAHVLHKLSDIDTRISASRAAALASLVFPPPSMLEQIIKEKLPAEPPAPPEGSYTAAAAYNIRKSQLIYETIQKSIDTHIYYLKKSKIFV